MEESSRKEPGRRERGGREAGDEMEPQAGSSGCHMYHPLKARLVRSQPEIRAQGRDLGVDLALIMTFKCLNPGRIQAIQDPQLKGGRGGYWGLGMFPSR